MMHLLLQFSMYEVCFCRFYSYICVFERTKECYICTIVVLLLMFFTIKERGNTIYVYMQN
jgi:hypothetical protein